MNEALLAESLWKDTLQLHEVSRIESSQVVNLRLAKLNATLASLRSVGRIDLAPRILDIQDKLLMIEYHAQAQEKARRAQSVSVPREDVVVDLNDTPDMPESSLRRRRRRSMKIAEAGDVGSKLEVQEYQQQELGEDILEMVKAIKQNVLDFGQKLETDRDLVSATTDAITKTGASVTSVGSRLMKYRRSSAIGWMFYIYATLFILGVWILSIVLIQIVPKW